MCGQCQVETTIWDIGGRRWKFIGNKAITTRCQSCRKIATFDVRWRG